MKSSKIINRIIRKNTKKVFVKNVQIGGQNNIVIQTMLTSKPRDVKIVIKEINKLAKMGCEIVRLSCFKQDDVDALKIICKKSPIPIVADIHYNYIYAIMAVENGASKIRINPGNIGKDKIQKIAEICKKKNIPIRIGINSGSIEPDLLLRYGFTAKAMIESAKRSIKILEECNFTDIVLSLKSSDPKVSVEAYRIASKLFKYPLHLGITEAGSLVRAIVKSTCSLGQLIKEGIGDTIRISISDDCKYEIKVAKELLRYYGIKKEIPNLISCPTCGRLNYKMLPLVKEIENFLDEISGNINIAIMGCTVNGPGEAKSADMAIFGEDNCVHLYIKGKFIRTIDNNEVSYELKKEIINYLKKNK